MDNQKKKIYFGMKKFLLYGLLLTASAMMQAQELLPWPLDTIDGKIYYRYTVEKSIGLYRISKNFSVSQESILEANPVLKTRGLHFEEIILVPANLPVVANAVEEKPEQPLQPEASVIPEIPENQVIPEKQEIPELTEIPTTEETQVEVPMVAEILPEVHSADTPQDVHYTDTVRLTYLLPLQADMVQRNPTIDRFYDFYAGSLLALKHHEANYVDSVGNRHITYYDVQTYDIGKSVQALTALIDSGALAHTDAIIGPAYNKQVEALSAYAQENKIPVLVPFLPVVPDIKTNPYLLQFNPSDETHTHALMEHLDSLRQSINIVLVDAGKADIPASIRTLRDSIRARHLPTTYATIRQILSDSISQTLKDSVENLLLFHSERYSNVQLLMPYLLSGRHGKRLTILSQYAWQSEHILLPQLFTAVFRTPDSEAMALYDKDFAQYFGHQLSSTLPRYDLLGYDLTSYMLQAIRGGVFSASTATSEGLQSSMLFTPIENGGFENTHIIIQRR